MPALLSPTSLLTTSRSALNSPSLSLSAVVASVASGWLCICRGRSVVVDRGGTDGVRPCRLVEQRVSGLPLEQVLGWADFCGQRIAIDAGVFVPRRRSEFLVRHAAAVTHPGAVVVDMCCGSGAIGAALAAVQSHRTCMPSTSTRSPCSAHVAISTAGYTRATCTSRCPRRCEVVSTCSLQTRRTCRPTRSRSCPQKLACTNRKWRWTAGWTALRSSDGSLPAHRFGSRRRARC